MGTQWPTYLDVPSDRLGEGSGVTVRTCRDRTAVARDMAEAILNEIRFAAEQGRAATLIVPVGPVDQFPILADEINRHHIDCRDVMLINMDEYLTDADAWIDRDHPLSFRGYMDRALYDRIEADLAPAPENRVFPRPEAPEDIARLIDQRGGVDACFGGIGINGHIAFNEPPEPGESCSDEAFRSRPTRCLDLSRETRTINAVTVGGAVAVIPRRAITVGMKEILAARRLRFYGNRPWQSSVIRRVLHGPIGPDCPASFLRTHDDAMLTLADYVAARPDIRLR